MGVQQIVMMGRVSPKGQGGTIGLPALGMEGCAKERAHIAEPERVSW